MAKLVKQENAIANCPNCGQQMVCKMIGGSGDFEPKLQWQNDKGESHYLKPVVGQDGKRTFPCRPYTTESKGVVVGYNDNPPQTKIDFKREFVSDTEEQKWTDIVCKATEYVLLAQNTLSVYPIENPALKGLITKVAFKVLEQQKKVKVVG